MSEPGESQITPYLGLCNVCAARDPHWEVVRIGDVMVRLACDEDLATICASMQRDSEVTRLTVEDRRKQLEWGGIARSLEQVVQEGPRARLAELAQDDEARDAGRGDRHRDH